MTALASAGAILLTTRKYFVSLPWLMPPAGTSRIQVTGLRWLVPVLFAGAVAGTVQTVRGAHYPSHTLWTLVICGGVSLALWRLLLPRLVAKPA